MRLDTAHFRRTHLLVWGLVMVGVGVGLGLWSPWKPAEAEGAGYTTEQIHAVYRANQDRWATTPKLALGTQSESAIKDAIDVAVEDTNQVLSAVQRASLVDRLASEIRLRSGADPEPYLRYAATRPGERWIDARDTKDWERLNTLFQEQNSTRFELHQGKEALEFLVNDLFRSRDSVFCSIGIPGPESECGAKVCAIRARSEEDAWMQIDRVYRDQKARERWSFGPATHARRFRIPERSVDAVARSAGSVRLAHAQFVVETESQATGLWESVWYWDGESSWQCLSMWKRGTDRFTVWY